MNTEHAKAESAITKHARQVAHDLFNGADNVKSHDEFVVTFVDELTRLRQEQADTLVKRAEEKRSDAFELESIAENLRRSVLIEYQPKAPVPEPGLSRY